MDTEKNSRKINKHTFIYETKKIIFTQVIKNNIKEG